jgi:hypothetical protein
MRPFGKELEKTGFRKREPSPHYAQIDKTIIDDMDKIHPSWTHGGET